MYDMDMKETLKSSLLCAGLSEEDLEKLRGIQGKGGC